MASALTGEGNLDVPDSGLTPEMMQARAAALQPRLRELQDDTEDRGFYGADVHAEFKEAGFYRMIQPRRYGGYEFDMENFFRVIVAIARGCPSTGWCLSLGSGHSFIVASHFPEAAQQEAFGPAGHFVCPHRAWITGEAARADGGYVLSGTWPYCSGVPYATHFMGTTALPRGDAGDLHAHAFLVPAGEFARLDDWGGDRTLGMRGSGSFSVRLDNVFVPDHRIVPQNWVGADFGEGSPGTALHGNPLYLGRNAVFYAGEICSVLVGAAWAALDEYERLMETKLTLMPPRVLRKDDPQSQTVYGMARNLASSAEALLLEGARRYMRGVRRWAETGEPYTPLQDVENAALVQRARLLAYECVELVFENAGTSEARRGARIQRYHRDVAMQRTQGGDGTLMMASLGRAHWRGVPEFMDI